MARRFILPIGPKAAVTVAGDAGGGGANLDYQVVGLFTYNFTRKFGLGLGWRYLDVDYRPGNHQFVYDVAQSGALAGIYFNFGGKPPVPPTASCSASPTEVYPGDPVNRFNTGREFQSETYPDAISGTAPAQGSPVRVRPETSIPQGSLPAAIPLQRRRLTRRKRRTTSHHAAPVSR